MGRVVEGVQCFYDIIMTTAITSTVMIMTMSRVVEGVPCRQIFDGLRKHLPGLPDQGAGWKYKHKQQTTNVKLQRLCTKHLPGSLDQGVGWKRQKIAWKF